MSLLWLLEGVPVRITMPRKEATIRSRSASRALSDPSVCHDRGMSDEQLRIDVVGTDRAGELMTVRRAAFVTEAQIFNDPNIPALTQTLDELIVDLESPDVVTLGAWQGTRLVGSIRVGIEDSKATIGRLAVVPDL